ncbi:MAG: UDP-2,3-diacylglucosamine hydrolase [Stygiobacter sp. RIFOXYC12_FULL_38_8]|nr:MAG: UDP-2,3-diacylglucosamine hydrolase [Stygiobacter sp. GWC2_38_9]OGU81579.1 MAG: UDP-2,3-diacylglucosamine hydrolase [Stygiobacter sp. RIFOXYA12_FULL_38_9]OGV08312.1 MAG: UDP-2,3-diacylglucosamine hydrolase [Stygiobacter sp. RIFOXYB2_FULL_37_11]OGV12139.1 MAG: UDP-2,3-diacylglucosamine hydrolase [Stygiobacter sp. RIFOXYC2_FULL_38_25]OGV12186.1 MAG: UDP-2,3-diacylglucosamine hydrolase [Stygiobacter sp. RIFOXYA2_FULL_38_8]OGV24176.1 MAG: UDP-2,3-diacylglucosamine hydrolase [Stygiobacter s
MKTYFFISDVHLGLQNENLERGKEKLLVDFLKFAESNCDELFIVGDLFDYWFEYKRVIQKGFIRTLGALASFRDTGKDIHYIIGNHDFLHKDFFEKEIGAKVYEEEIITELNGSKFFIAHGDGLMAGDNGYKMLKKVLRNKFIQRVYSIIHPDLGIKIASGSSKASRDYTSTKNYGEFSGLLDTAKMLINKEYDYVVFGHSHRRTIEKIDNGMYVNLGTWLKKPCYGKFTNKFEIIDWE